MPTAREISKKPIVLVAGGASYLGTQLCQALVSQNCQVYCLDNLEAGKKERLSKLFGEREFLFVEHDIEKPIPQNLPQFSHVYDLLGIEEYVHGKNITLEHLVSESHGLKTLLERTVEDKAKFILASTFDVYQGVLSSLFLKHYWGFSEEHKRHFSQHEAKRYAEALTVAYYDRHGIEAVIVRLGDIYGPEMNLEGGGKISVLIGQAVKKDQIEIEGEGLQVLHPTFISDVIFGLVKAGFSPEAPGRIINLVSDEGITEINFAYALKQVLLRLGRKDVAISFSRREEEIRFPIPKVEIEKSQEALGWKPRTSLEDGLKTTLTYFFGKEDKEIKEEERVGPKVEEKHEVALALPKFHLPKLEFPRIHVAFPRFSLPGRFGLLLLTAFFILILNLFLLPVMQFILGGYFAINSLLALKKIENKDSDTLVRHAESSVFYFQEAQRGLRFLSAPFIVLGKENLRNSLFKQLLAGEEASKGAKEAFLVLEEASELSRTILSKEGEVNLSETQARVKPRIQRAKNHFALAQVFLEDVEDIKISKFFDGFDQTTSEEIARVGEKLAQAMVGIELLPKILAWEGEREYLLLFQNNLELRPTGGFIGSYGILKFKNGKLSDVVIDDVYNLDGQQKFTIEPPLPIKTHLKVDNWYLRDANWNPDFVKTGKTVQEFYRRNTGKEVAGVWAINVDAIKELIPALGPVELSDYNETITQDNLAEKAQFYSEIGFFPGSTSKKDFLGSLARQMILKLEDESAKTNWAQVFLAIAKGIDNKNILFQFNEGEIQAFLAQNQFAGSLPQISTAEPEGKIKIISDYLYPVEANVGANKANRFLKRSITYEPTIGRDGDITAALTLVYKNESPADTWPGGNYKTYLRIYAPLASTLSSIDNGGNTDPTQVEVGKEDDKEIFGFLVEVPVGQEKKVVLIFRPNYILAQNEGTALYKLIFGKQPGAKVDPLEINLSYPSYLKAQDARTKFTQKEQSLEFKEELSRDLEFEVLFSSHNP